jgi:hypothetical protein
VLTPPGDHGAVFDQAFNDSFGACLVAAIVERGRGAVSC